MHTHLYYYLLHCHSAFRRDVMRPARTYVSLLGRVTMTTENSKTVRKYCFVLDMCADELVVGGGVGWSYDRLRRRAAHFSSAAAAWLYGRRRRRQRRQTGRESTETSHSLGGRFFLVLQGSATSPVTSAGRLAPKS